MSKYILKKDLPFAKAGEVFELTNKFIDHNCISVKGQDGLQWEIGFSEDLDRLIADGWIEEEKTDILDKIIEMVRDYPNEVQKELMKQANKTIRQWYAKQKEEPTDKLRTDEFTDSYRKKTVELAEEYLQSNVSMTNVLKVRLAVLKNLEGEIINEEPTDKPEPRYFWKSKFFSLDLFSDEFPDEPLEIPFIFKGHRYNILIWYHRGASSVLHGDANSIRVGIKERE